MHNPEGNGPQMRINRILNTITPSCSSFLELENDHSPRDKDTNKFCDCAKLENGGGAGFFRAYLLDSCEQKKGNKKHEILFYMGFRFLSNTA